MRDPYFRYILRISRADQRHSPVWWMTLTSSCSALSTWRVGARSGIVARSPANQLPARNNPEEELNRAPPTQDRDGASTPLISSICGIPLKSNQVSRKEKACRVSTYDEFLDCAPSVHCQCFAHHLKPDCRDRHKTYRTTHSSYRDHVPCAHIPVFPGHRATTRCHVNNCN